MMFFNELAQWAIIIVMSVFVFGLVRQLGHFLVPRRDHLMYLGPDIGKGLPASLLKGLPVEQLKEQIQRSRAGLGLVAVVNDRCGGCKGMLLQLKELGPPFDGPLVALADTNDPDYLAYIGGLFTYVLQDEGGTRAHDAGVIATPFVLALDGDLKVKHRGISGGLHELVDEWAGLRHGSAPQGNGSATHAEHFDTNRADRLQKAI
jgi:hypothetical protein